MRESAVLYIMLWADCFVDTSVSIQSTHNANAWSKLCVGAGLGIILCASLVACTSFSYIGNIACLVTSLLSWTVSSSPVTALVSVVQGIHHNHHPPTRTCSYQTELTQIHGECLLNKVGGWLASISLSADKEEGSPSCWWYMSRVHRWQWRS